MKRNMMRITRYVMIVFVISVFFFLISCYPK